MSTSEKALRTLRQLDKQSPWRAGTLRRAEQVKVKRKRWSPGKWIRKMRQRGAWCPPERSC